MKHNYQHIFKKTYAKPVIEEVMIDVAISIAMATEPPIPPVEPTDPTDPDGFNPIQQSELSTYQSASLPSSTSPFGTSPEY